MKVNYERASEVKNDFKLNVEGQQDYLFFFKVQCDLDDEDEVQEITAARKPMKSKKD